MTPVDDVHVYTTEDGCRFCEIFIFGRRALFWVERGETRIGWAISSLDPSDVRDGAGYVTDVPGLFEIFRRALGEGWHP